MRYFMGLDMGTSSVGWAVTDEHYQLLRRKGKDMWGMYITGKTNKQLSVRNKVSLCLTQNWVNYIKNLENDNDDNITEKENLELYDILSDKHNNTIYRQRPNPVGSKLHKCRDRFINLKMNEQKKYI